MGKAPSLPLEMGPLLVPLRQARVVEIIEHGSNQDLLSGQQLQFSIPDVPRVRNYIKDTT